jgi:type II secretory pathway component PulM
MKAWFQQLTQREQIYLLVVTFAVALYLLYVVIAAPLGEARDRMAQQNVAVASSLQRVDQMVSRILYLRESGERPNSGRNLTTLINSSTSAMNLPVSRLQPNSRGEIQVRLESAAFDDLIAWLHQMEYGESLLVREVSITQAGNAGRVNATVRIAQAG